LAIYATMKFARLARRNAIAGQTLLATARDVLSGHIDADLGGGVIKQRVARTGGGKSGGFRVLIIAASGSRLVFADAFAKSDRANISEAELVGWRRYAAFLMGASVGDFERLLELGELEQLDGH
jgi:hypothetical protein